jgi:hypothetical protein
MRDDMRWIMLLQPPSSEWRLAMLGVWSGSRASD